MGLMVDAVGGGGRYQSIGGPGMGQSEHGGADRGGFAGVCRITATHLGRRTDMAAEINQDEKNRKKGRN